MTRTGLLYAALAVAFIASLLGNWHQHIAIQALQREFAAYTQQVELEDLARREGLTVAQRLAVTALIQDGQK